MTPSPNYFNAHLREVDESYGRHFLHAGYYFVMLLAAAICALIHAILPFLFEKDLQPNYPQALHQNDGQKAV